MTTTLTTSTSPRFSTHHAVANLRGVFILLFCAIMTALFVASVQRGATQGERELAGVVAPVAAARS